MAWRERRSKETPGVRVTNKPRGDAMARVRGGSEMGLAPLERGTERGRGCFFEDGNSILRQYF